MNKFTVGDAEAALYAAFPKSDAEVWDNPGLAVGDASQKIEGVAVALDPDVWAVQQAADKGCNLLVTHHPVFIGAGPAQFGPATQAATAGPGRVVYEAARLGVSIIAMHTNADRALRVRQRFASTLGWECAGSFEQLQVKGLTAKDPGFGAMFRFGEPMNLNAVEQACRNAFGGAPRVWGDAQRKIYKLAYLNGSWSEEEVYQTCVEQGIQCIIVGETKYHFCVDAQPHLSIVEMGHDVSELPIVLELKAVLEESGIDAQGICNLTEAPAHWWTGSMRESKR